MRPRLRLVRDDVPIRGRVVDPQGRPIAGATVRLRQIATVKDGVDLDAMLASGELDNDQTAAWYGDYNDAIWPGGHGTPGRPTPTAGSRSRGVGRDRIAALEIRGPDAGGWHALRDGPAGQDAAEAPPAADAAEPGHDVHAAAPPSPRLVGATFEHIVGPTKPIVGVVRSKATGQPVEGIRVFGRRGRPGRRSRPGPTPRAASASSACPRARSIRSPPTKDTGPSIPSSAPGSRSPTPRGSSRSRRRSSCPGASIVTGRLIDPATGRPVRPGQVSYFKLPTNPNAGDGNQRPNEPDRPDLPADRPARRGDDLCRRPAARTSPTPAPG